MTVYDSIELTEEEIAAAILEGKKRKYFHTKHAEYWAAQEKNRRGAARDQTNNAALITPAHPK